MNNWRENDRSETRDPSGTQNMSSEHFCENFFLESMHIHFFKSQALYLTTLHLVQSLQHFPAVASESLRFNPADYAVQPES